MTQRKNAKVKKESKNLEYMLEDYKILLTQIENRDILWPQCLDRSDRSVRPVTPVGANFGYQHIYTKLGSILKLLQWKCMVCPGRDSWSF